VLQIASSPDPGLGLRRSLRLARPWARTDRSTRDTSLPYPYLAQATGGQDRRPIWLAPVTSNDGSPRASMTTVVLSPLRKQGDVSKISAAPTAVLLQGLGTSPTATLPCTQGSSTSPTATLACTQGLGTSLADTLAHSYTPIVHLDPLLASIKGRSRAFMREGHAGERADDARARLLVPEHLPEKRVIRPGTSSAVSLTMPGQGCPRPPAGSAIIWLQRRYCSD
jgi:hypothetical protein